MNGDLGPYRPDDQPRFMHEQLIECAPALRIETHERLAALQFETLTKRMDRLEIMMERLERRLWLTVYGVVALVLAQAVTTILPQISMLSG